VTTFDETIKDWTQRKENPGIGLSKAGPLKPSTLAVFLLINPKEGALQNTSKLIASVLLRHHAPRND